MSAVPVKAAAFPADAPRAAVRLEVALAAIIFCLSGAAALIYQVSWQRILVLHSGIGVYSIAMIVAAFMVGLGAGSHLGGVWSARVEPRQALRLFGLLELGVAAFAAASCGLYYDLLYQRAAWLYDVSWRVGLLHLLALIVPTTLMGMSLPFLVRAIVRRPEEAPRTIGTLYALNVLGASLGALLTPWVLIRFLGIRGAVAAGVVCNMIAGLAALAMRRAAARGREAAAQDEPRRIHFGAAPRGREAAAQDEPRRIHFGAAEDEGAGLGDTAPAVPERAAAVPAASFRLCLALYVLSGFCALALEIVWFRMIEVAVKATAFTFGTVLSVYLLGLALGTLAGVRWGAAVRRPLEVFLFCQSVLIAYSVAAAVLLVRLPPRTPGYLWFYEYWTWYDGYLLGERWDPAALLRLYVLLPVALYALPTALMGFSFVVLQKAVQSDVRTSGRKVGALQAANILGCVAGSLLVGLVTLSSIGTPGTLRLLAACGLAFALLGARRYGWRSAFTPLAVALVLAASYVPRPRRFWLRLHGNDGSSAPVEEDATGVVAMMPLGQRWQMFVNGRGISSLPFGGTHSALGSVPAVIHPAPTEVAVVGLGSGDTAWAAACRPETERIVVFEVSAPQPRVLERVAGAEGLADLRRFLVDPRLTIRVVDGRIALEREGRRYDIIEADPLPPQGAYSGNLYSLEFFRQCAGRLKPGGLMCSWAPTGRVVATFRQAFPHVLRVRNGEILVGSNEPIVVDLPAWRRRLRSPPVSAYLGSAIVEDTLASLKARVPEDIEEDPNRDLFPRDEFRTP